MRVKLAAQVAVLQEQLMATEDREARLKATVRCLGEELVALQNQLMQDTPRDHSGLLAAGEQRETKLKTNVLGLSQEVASLQSQLMQYSPRDQSQLLAERGRLLWATEGGQINGQCFGLELATGQEREAKLTANILGLSQELAVLQNQSIRDSPIALTLNGLLAAGQERETKLKAKVSGLSQEVASLQSQLMQDTPREQARLLGSGHERDAKLTAKVVSLSQEVAALQNQIMMMQDSFDS